ncbi:MAG TPA: sialidase family protein [Telluria sp.]|jgi:hypothetical protein
MPFPFKPARALLPALFLLLAAGPCAAGFFPNDPNNPPKADDPLVRAPKPDEGTVAVSMTTNLAAILELTGFRVRRIGAPGKGKPPQPDDKNETYTLTPVAPELAFDSALFIGVLPAGDYQMAEVTLMPYDVTTYSGTDGTDFVTRTYQPVLAIPNVERYGTFTVSPGQTVDLGRTVLTPLNKITIFGRSGLNTDNRLLFERRSPGHARLLGTGAVPGWNAPRGADDVAEALALRRPVGTGCFSEYPDGRIAAAAKMGSVLLRSVDGAWTTVHAKGIDSLACVLPVALPDATLIGVGEANTIVKLAPGASTLSLVDPGNLPIGNLVYVAGNESAGWYVASHNRERLTVFHAQKIDGGNWTQMISLPLQKNFWWGQSGFWPWRTAKGFGFALHDSLHLLDYASGQWVTRKMPHETNVAAAQASPNGAIGVRGKMMGGAYLSKDEGLSWKEVPTPARAWVPLQLSNGDLYVSSTASAGYAEAGPILHSSSDGGAKWIQIGQFPGGKLEILPSGAMLSHGTARGYYTIRRSGDNGVSWTMEYNNHLRQR